MKEQLSQLIENQAEALVAMSDYIFDHPELGLVEYEAAELICKYLEEHGFAVERGIAGLETAFKGVYQNGEGGPVIGLLVEYDALEKLGHACGHHMQGPCLLGSAVAIKELCKDEPYTLVVYGTPAEETTSGKVTMIKENYFTELDIALMMHGNPGTTVDVHSMAMVKYEVTFHGVSAHAALRPQAGKSALDALILAFNGLEFLREHTADDTRIHYTVLDAGGAANSVPKQATGSFYVRTYDSNYLDHLTKRFDDVMRGAALMSDTEVEIKVMKRLEAKVPVYSLNDLVMENARYYETDDIVPPRDKTGSTDFGNVMKLVPGTVLRMGFVPKGASSHSQAYLDHGKGESAVRGVVLGGKIMAGVCYDLITRPELVAAAKEEFKEYQSRTHQ